MKISAAMLLRLTGDTDYTVRREVATREDLPDGIACKVFERLHRDENWYVRYHIARNKSIPRKCIYILKNLYDSEDEIIRSAVTYNPLWKECGGGV